MAGIIESRWRERPALAFDRLARAALFALLATLPWRLRLWTLARPSPPVYADFSDVLLFASDVCLLALALFWGVKLAARPFRLQAGPVLLWLPLAGLAAAGWLSVVTAVDPLAAGAQAIRMSLLFLLYLFLLNETRVFPLVGAGLAVQVAVQTAVAIGQWLRQADLGLAGWGELALDAAQGSPTVWAQGGRMALRAAGLSDHPNILAAGLAFSLLMLLACYLRARPWAQAAWLFLFVAAGAALFFTFSRTAWLALVLGGLAALALWRYGNRERGIGRWLLLALVMMAVALPFVWQNRAFLSSGEQLDVIAARLAQRQFQQAERQALNEAANQLFINHAITGVGLGGLAVALRQNQPDFIYNYQPARMVLIDAAAEVGLFGALFYLAASLSPWALMRWRRRLSFSPELAAASGMLMAILLFGLFDAYPWFAASGRLWQWLAWGLWARAYVNSQQSTVNRYYLGDVNV